MIMTLRGFQGRNLFRGLAILLLLSVITLYLSYLALKDSTIIDLFHVPTDEEEEEIFQSTFENDGFLVFSTKCQIPNFNPYDESIRKFVTLGKPIVCSTKSPLTYVKTISEGAGKYLLKINTCAMADYAVEPESVSCCYSVINRVNDPAGKNHSRDSDNRYSVTTCLYFKTELVLNSDEEFILVQCFQATESGSNKDIYTNTHALVTMKADVEIKLHKTSSESSSMDEQRFSVLLFGLDSVSRLNLLRTMPKTVEHLRRSGWLQMSGYNKVGENTLPNLVAVLTGLSMEQLKKRCWPSYNTNFDTCPFI
jgi:Protein of unknown function (DUF229).